MPARPARAPSRKRTSRPTGSASAHTSSDTRPVWSWRIAMIVLVGTGVIIGGVWTVRTMYATVFPPRTTIGGMRVSGMTQAEAQQALQAYVNGLEQTGITVWNGNDSATVTATAQPTDDIDLAYDVIRIEIPETVDTAWDAVHASQPVLDAFGILGSILRGYSSDVQYSLNEDAIASLLHTAFSKTEYPAVDSSFIASGDTLMVTADSNGMVIDTDTAIESIGRRVAALSTEPVTVSLVNDIPRVRTRDAEALIPDAKRFLAKAPITIAWEGHTWEFDRTAVVSWLTVTEERSSPLLAINPDALTASFAMDIAPFVETEMQNGKFLLDDNRVTEFQPSREGRSIDYPASAELIRADTIAAAGTQSGLVTEMAEPQFAVNDLNTLGIKEIIGVGTSDMHGSPVNRRHNIAVGADSLNGLLIPPDETFSLVSALGEIDGDHGYLQELVIKDNKTIPEYGGGLCQIGTTTFRAALASGLPIVERQNHSYQVSYYFDENGKSGTDATIYDPSPDFKFTNDTGHSIMIRTAINGNTVRFEFWGTRDGRVAAQTSPTISNVVAPPPTKLVETTDLAPGEKKCTEHAHAGATAEFDYTVTYADGRVEDEVFRSVYKPWQEVCLIGVDPATLEEEQSDQPPVQTAGDDTPKTESPTNANTNATPTNTNTAPKGD